MKKVFVSSKQGELDLERAALHQALQSSEWDNFTIEFSGAFPNSVRNVFLKNVAECDVYLGIFAGVYSQPTVDEYHKAKELGKPILIYLKKSTDRESKIDEFIRAELQPSHKYQEFSTTEELISHLPDIRRALDEEVKKYQRQAYLDALVSQTELLELAGIVDTGEHERPKLQDIFIALSAEEEVAEEVEEHNERSIKITHRVTINEAFRDHRNLMILGDPGAGKSTLLQYLTLVAAQGGVDAPVQELWLPISIRLSSFVQSRQSFVEYFESYAEKQLHVSLGKIFFERTLEDGHAIVCLDGFDEVSQPAQRIEVRNAITTLAARYPRSRFIITSRVAGYDSASLDKRVFAHHTIVPFGEKEIQAFVEKWYAAREREQAKTRAASLFNDLKANERLLKLAENPLTLTIIALVHQRARGKLPDARVELYDHCADTLIEEWDKWKGLTPEDRERPYYKRRRHWLERAAYWMHIESQEQDVAQISKRGLEMKIAEFLVEDEKNLPEEVARDEAKQFVALATSRTGILVEREQGTISFIHLTFQEYFVASDLYWHYRRTPDALWQVIQPHLYAPRWLEVILLLLGRLNDDGDTSSIIVEKILRKRDKFDKVVHRNLFLAARCLADRVNVREPLENEIANTLFKYAIAEDPHSLRLDAIQALGTLRGNSRASKGLLSLAQDDLGRVNSYAIQALGQLGRTDNSIIQDLLTLAQDQKGWRYRQKRIDAIQALGQLGRTNDAIIQGLLALAQDEKADTWERTLALQSLRRLRCTDDVVIQGLLVLMQGEKVWEEVRSQAAWALGELGRTDDVVIQGLLSLAKDVRVNKYWQQQKAVAQALGQLGRANDTVIQCLLMLAQDKYVRYDAAEALRQLGCTDDAMQLLLELAQDEKAIRRDDAVKALGQLGRTDDVVIQGLLALSQDKKANSDVRSDAVKALGQLGHTDDVVIQGLLELAQDALGEVKGAAVYALGQLGRADDVVIQGLLELTVQSDGNSAAVRALGQLGRADDTVIRGLLALAQDVSIGGLVRYDAAEALRQLGCTNDAVQLLLALAQDVSVEGYVRRDAAKALGQLGRTTNAVQLLLALAEDKKAQDEVRSDAVQALGQMGHADNAVIQGLLALAQDVSVEGYVRRHAAEALGQLGCADYPAKLLLAWVKDETRWALARRDAADALGRLGCTDDVVIQGLLELAQCVNMVVEHASQGQKDAARYSAMRALEKLGKKESRVTLVLLNMYDENDQYNTLKECVGNLRYEEVNGRCSVSSWWKKIRARFLVPLGMTSGKS